MKREEGLLEFIGRCLPDQPCVVQQKKLIQKLNGDREATYLAVTYIKKYKGVDETSLLISDYLSLYESKILSDRSILPNPLAIALQLVVDKMVELPHGREASEIFHLAAFLGASKITSWNIFTIVYGYEESVIGAAINILKNHDIIESDPNSPRSIKLKHRLGPAIRGLRRGLEVEFLNRVLTILSASEMDTDTAARAKTLWQYASKHDSLLEKHSYFVSKIVCKLNRGNTVSDALQFGMVCLEAMIKRLGSNGLAIFCLIYNMVAPHPKEGKIAIPLIRRYFHHSHANTARGSYTQQKNALRFFSNVLKSFKAKDINENNFNFLQARGFVAFLEYKIGDLSRRKAIGTLNEVIESLKGYDLRSPSTKEILFTAEHNLGHLLVEDNRPEEAIQVLEDVLQQREELLGKFHPYSIETNREIGFALAKQGKYLDSLNVFTQVLDRQEMILGSDHETTCCTRLNMGFVSVATQQRRLSSNLPLTIR